MSKPVKIVIIIVALAAGGFLIANSLRGGEPSVEGRQVSYYICADPKCATEFEVAPGESIAPPESPTEICPTCKKDWPIKAGKCASCGKLCTLDGHGIAPAACPHCGGGPVVVNGA